MVWLSGEWHHRRGVLVHRDSPDGSEKTEFLAQALVLKWLLVEEWLKVMVLLKRLEVVVVAVVGNGVISMMNGGV